MRNLLFLFSVSIISFISVAANMGSRNDIDVRSAWSRTTGNRTISGAVYLTIQNSGTETARIIGAESPVAKQVMIHETIEENGINRMQHRHHVDIKAGSSMTFTPGGYHIMLMGLHAPLKEGDSFPATLKFENGDKRDFTVQVTSIKGLTNTNDHKMH